jgi:hypothetical protein
MAYVLLLLAVAVTSAAAATAVQLGAAASRREAEIHLLAIGADFERALQSYAGVAKGAAGSAGRGPRTLEDLLLDPRSPGVHRHLRQVYADPLTGKKEWGLIRDNLGSITGVYSLAPGRPIRQGPATGTPGEVQTYQEWVFGIATR